MAEVETKEIASIERDPTIPLFTKVLLPGDTTLKARMRGVDLYDEIRRDPHAFAVLQKRSLEVCSREWAVFEASDKRIDKKAADLLKRQLKAINFDKLTRGLNSGAVLKGFAVAEILWANVGGEWLAGAIKVRNPRRFRFTVDGELRLITRASPLEGEPVPERKFIVHRYAIDDHDDDPYGLGIGSVLFWPAWFKRQVLANWLRATERFASPTVDASYSGSYDKKRQDEILTALRTMSGDAGIVHPDGVTLELLEASKGGGGDFLEALSRYLDELMSEAVLGETLSTNSGERGARSLGEVHNEVRIAIAKADADMISQTLKETLIQWLVELNYPGAQLPDVWRDFAEAEDLDKRVLRDKAIFDMGYEPADEEYFDETYGGEWTKKEPVTTGPADPAAEAGATAEETSTLDELFAERGALDVDDPDALADQLDQLAAPAIGGMLEQVRAAVDQAVSYDDLSDRLLQLAADIGVDDLAALMEQATTVAELTGRASVDDEVG